MTYRNFTVALVAMAVLGISGAAEAQSRNHGERLDRGRHGGEHRVAPRGFAHQVDRRQARQRARIRDGRQNGELNHRESRRLRQDQRHVNRLERRFGADGRYSPRERRILDRNLDRSSRHIARAKNNDRQGYGNRGDHSGFGNRGDRRGHGYDDRAGARPDHNGRGRQDGLRSNRHDAYRTSNARRR